MGQKLALLAVGGGLGALARYGLAGLVQRGFTTFPMGTAVVNMLGCFLIGLVWAVTAERFAVLPNVRVALLVGFLGAFTTFSTYVLETSDLIGDSEYLLAGLNVAGQNVIGVVAFFLGLALGRLI
jgi:CrcB protein